MSADDTINSMLRHLRAVWRAETLLAEIKLQALLKRGSLLVFAGVVGVFGLAMLNGAAYFALAPDFGNAGAMGIVAFADFVIAGGLVLFANRAGEDPRAEIAGSASAALIGLVTAILRTRRKP